MTVQTECLAEGFYTSQLDALHGLPVRTFLPAGYEPNYPYPLLVFFHGQGGNEEQVLKLAPKLSRRNYVCIALRGPQALGPSNGGEARFGWGANLGSNSLVEDYVLRSIEQTRRRYHIHSERIFLAGFWEGASLAYRIGLAHPQRFGGIISLNGTMPRHGAPLFRMSEMRQLRVLIGHGIANPMIPVSLARRDFRLLYSAGVRATFETYATTQRLHADMLRDVDRWLIRSIESY